MKEPEKSKKKQEFYDFYRKKFLEYIHKKKKKIEKFPLLLNFISPSFGRFIWFIIFFTENGKTS